MARWLNRIVPERLHDSVTASCVSTTNTRPLDPSKCCDCLALFDRAATEIDISRALAALARTLTGACDRDLVSKSDIIEIGLQKFARQPWSQRVARNYGACLAAATRPPNTSRPGRGPLPKVCVEEACARSLCTTHASTPTRLIHVQPPPRPPAYAPAPGAAASSALVRSAARMDATRRRKRQRRQLRSRSDKSVGGWQRQLHVV